MRNLLRDVLKILKKILGMGLNAVLSCLDLKVNGNLFIETTKKYLLANLVNKLREFLMEKIGESEEQP